MKKAVFFITVFAALIFSSCVNGLTTETNENTGSPKKVLITLGMGQARTALPEISSTWEGFTFSLTAVQNPGEATQKAAVTVFEDRSYSDLCQGFTIDEGKYRFVLDAYKNGQKGLSGEEILDLSSGSTVLSFLMYPSSGAVGSASVKIYFPNDGTVKTVKAGISSSIFLNAESVKTTDLTISIESGSCVVSYSPSALPSATEQYALFWFYDANGSLVYSGTESLIVVGGCVSKSEITLTADDWHTYLCTVTLNKDGAGWTNSGKTVTLVNETSSDKKYSLKAQTEGKYSASVAEGLYYVFVNDESTGIEFNSVDQTAEVNYFTVQLDPSMKEEKIIYPELMEPVTTYVFKRCTMECISGGIEMDDNLAVVQRGKSLTYRIIISDGYEAGEDGVTVSVNGSVVSGAVPGVEITLSSVTEAALVLVEGIEVKTYTISYYDSDKTEVESYASHGDADAYWFDYSSGDKSYVPVTSFTADTSVELPAIVNVRKAGSYFDAWVDEDGTVVKTTEGIFENLKLYATWKAAPSVDDANKTIYANGFNLLIAASDENNTLTYIYVDFNGDGVSNDDDFQITCTNIATGESDDFSGYTLRAGTQNGDAINSDFTFTMTGGTIASIYGLGKSTEEHPYTSRLNLSGTAVIGSVTGETTVANEDSTKTTTATAVTGIMLDTFSDERVNITGKMSGFTNGSGDKCSYSITCVTPYKFDENVTHTIAYIKNSSYASFNYFTCWTDLTVDDSTANPPYEKCILSQKNVTEYSVTRTLVNLSDDAGIVLPKADEVVFNEETGEFKFDDNIITAQCSVFSIAVENGTFRCNERLTITEDTSDEDKAVEATLTYMAQPTATTYVESFEYNTGYVYMQIMSAGNQLTPEIASSFISQLYFKRTDENVPLTVTVNLEKIPSEQIYGDGDGKGGAEFKYFNGSFYKLVSGPLDDTRTYWTSAYNAAKNCVFNGLQGYLMNITSEVENNYIFTRFPSTASWTGGSRFIPNEGDSSITPMYDQSEYPSGTIPDTTSVSDGNAFLNGDTVFRWQAGPEAGVKFYNSKTGPVGSDFTRSDYEVTDDDGKVAYQRFNNKYFFTNVSGSEPNCKGSSGIQGSNDSREQCVQYLNSSGVDGYWNDLSFTSKTPTGYFVEFTPYETIYGKQTANYTPIKRTAVY